MNSLLMKQAGLFALAPLLFAASANAALIPHRTMAALIKSSDIVVYCEEREVQFQEIVHEKWRETRMNVKCTVLQNLKGDLKPGTSFTVEYDGLFRRYFFDKGPYTVVDGKGNVTKEHKPEYLPRGRALMFLHRDEKGTLQVVSAKLVVEGKAYDFVQASNPGPLVLALQQPENLKLATGQAYGEKELLEDAALALKKAQVPEITAMLLVPKASEVDKPFASIFLTTEGFESAFKKWGEGYYQESSYCLKARITRDEMDKLGDLLKPSDLKPPYDTGVYLASCQEQDKPKEYWLAPPDAHVLLIEVNNCRIPPAMREIIQQNMKRAFPTSR